MSNLNDSFSIAFSMHRTIIVIEINLAEKTITVGPGKAFSGSFIVDVERGGTT